MKIPAAGLLALLTLLLLAGCGGGGSPAGSSNTSATPGVGSGGSSKEATPDAGADADGAVKQATAPKAPAGSEVVACRRVGAEGEDAKVFGLRAAGTDCGAARTAMRRWQRSSGCRVGDGASRASCSLGSFRCQAIAVDRGTAVSCVRVDGADVSFVAGRRS